MAKDVSLLRRKLARAFIKEACQLTLNPPDWARLSEEQLDDYLSNSLLSLRAELMFQREWAVHREDGLTQEGLGEEQRFELAS